jgi:RNA polymerase sigma factor (sigma-70 family)
VPIADQDQPEQPEAATPPLGDPPSLRLVTAPAADWETVYRENIVSVYRFVHARIGNRPDAEDITAQTFLRALPRLRQGASEPEVRGYLFATARTVIADHWADRYGVTSEADVELLSDAPTEIVEGDGVRRADAILGRLPENYRRVLELRFLRGYSVRETARELGVTESNAKVLQFRALRKAARLDPDSGADRR